VHVLPAVADAVREAAAAGLFGAPFPTDLGGLGLPQTAYFLALGILKAGVIGTASYVMLTVANARLIAAFGSPAQVQAFACPQIEGRALGTMCLSETQAGSSLADIRTRAILDGEDQLGRRYRIKGSKMWISAGDHDIREDIIHLVLAKIAGPRGDLPAGTGGISLFIVPSRLPSGAVNDLIVTGLNHKMGYRGLSNCVLSLGDEEGAVGWLIGEPGHGLVQMFHMMNEARVGVGLGAAMLGLRAHRLSVDYARERVQGRALGERPDAGIAPSPIIDHADVRRMLLTQKAYAEGALALVLACTRMIDEGQSANGKTGSDATELLALLTPIAKTWPSEWALAANDIAIQIHGGYGYTRDFEVEQLWRDNRLNAIHEGTTGIQALDLLGRKIWKSKGVTLHLLGDRLMVAIGRASRCAETAPLAKRLEAAWRTLTDCVDRLFAAGDEKIALSGATPFQSALGHVVVAWLWLDIALFCVGRRDDDPEADRVYLEGKLAAARWFIETELPRSTLWLDQMSAVAGIAVPMSADAF
jgi:alkylation response protein AidB-like acyl-CoA dehydrogenase